ncbi:zinc-binding dehydrogenase [Pontibacter ummariensis]|uniref:Zinc-binding dehydrogenase n=1 Tax=Pontibacter ummariensis TaxID=1610492 RepID=A0A239KV54_9BACT|nr:zinc-binding dehydrogenase [Pontibacter ummariensis]SNT21104.1 Zinc-binding dehydrogenase [Pontibacter ummariensis]
MLDVLESTWVEKVRSLTAGKGVKVALDAVGGSIGTSLFDCVEANGSIILYGLLSQEPVQFYNASVIMKYLTIKGFGLDNWLSGINADQKIRMAQELVEQLSDPEFKLDIGRKCAFDNYKEACSEQHHQDITGKLAFWNV